jgi:eukaryotic-like serine/threonine-protein kinase
MSLEQGHRLGVYLISAPLGAGGMGEVYRARDTRLNRDVAIKVLPDQFTRDPERLSRFEREAQVLASLNHPHIAGILGIEESGGLRALVLELVEGQTLDQRIARGPVDLGEALEIAAQIADALDAAHNAGIVHRDLKPANIKLRSDGTVKVLDFGLAKVVDGQASGDPLHSPTVTAPTQLGTILGTARYMAPEQARGRLVDKRADVWALGCVIYELLTGRPAFPGETITETIAVVIEREPDWSLLPPSAPAAIRRLLKRCLQKDPRQRLRDAADARLEIEEARSDGAMETTPAREQPQRASWRSLGIAGLMGAAVATALAFTTLRQPAVPVAPDFSRVIRLTSGPAREAAPAISPDGKWIAYLSDAGGTPNVWVKFIAGGDPVNLTANSGLSVGMGTGVGGLEIPPDGARIVVMARPAGTVEPFSTYEVPAPLPGTPRKVLETNYLGARWSIDGSRMTFIRAGSAAGDALFVANADGTNREELVAARDGMHIHWPTWSADGYIYFFRTFTTVGNLDNAEVYRIRPEVGQQMEPLVQTTRRALYPLVLSNPPGLVYAANPFTAELRLWWRSAAGGAPRQLTTGVGEYSEPRASADGRTIVAALYELRQSLTRVPVGEGAETVPITDGFQGDLDPVLTSAGDRIVFSSSRDGNRHIWIARVDGSETRQVTTGASQDDRPALSNDGQRIAFVSDRGATLGIWTVDIEGGPPQRVVDAVPTGALTWSRDGRHIIFSAGMGAGPGLWKVSAAGGRPERITTPLFASEPAWSPTRDVIAYLSIKRESFSVSSVAFVDPSGTALRDLPPPPELGSNGFSNGMLAWSPDGRRLAVVAQQSNSTASIWIVDPDAAVQNTKLVQLPTGPRIRGLTWTRDGRAIIFGKHDWTSDIVLMEANR